MDVPLQIVVSAPGSPSASINPQGALMGGSPYTLSFRSTYASSNGAGAQDFLYRWGDGSPAADLAPSALVQTVTHTYQHPGTFLTTLKVTDSLGRTDTDAVIVQVSKAPSALTAAQGTVHTVSNTVSMSATLKRTDTNTVLAGKAVFLRHQQRAGVHGGRLALPHGSWSLDLRRMAARHGALDDGTHAHRETGARTSNRRAGGIMRYGTGTARGRESAHPKRLLVAVLAAGGLAAALSGSAAAATAGCTVSGGTATCTYLAGVNQLTVPSGVSQISVTAVGGTGGSAAYGGSGGRGAVVNGVLSVSPGETLFADVGGNGQSLSAGGANGGGNGGGSFIPTPFGGGGGGGGASDIRLTAGDLQNRLVVAAGGGGGGGGCLGFGQPTILGTNGGDAGMAGAGSAGGSPGTATSGGAGGGGLGVASGSLGSGGPGTTGCGGGGGGGGGLYGGGGGGGGSTGEGDGGGGGSSLVPAGGSSSLDNTATPQVVISFELASGSPAAFINPQGPLTGGSPYTLSFRSQASTANLNSMLYRWGDGTAPLSLTPSAFIQTVTHTYQHPGTFLTTLKITDSDGQTDTDSVIVTVSKSPSGFSSSSAVVHTLSNTISAQTTLKRTDANQPLAGKTVFFGANNALVCTATTNSSGVAACTGPLTGSSATAIANGVTATFVGDQDTLGASATIKPTSQANAADSPGSRARIHISRTARAARVQAIRGSAAHGTQSVAVAVVRTGPGACRILTAHGRLAHARKAHGWCVPTRFITATGTTRWTLRLQRHLTPGRYRIYALTTNTRGKTRVSTTTLTLT